MGKQIFKIRHIHTKYSLQIFFIIFAVIVLFTFLTLRQFQNGMDRITNSIEYLTGDALYEQTEKRIEVVMTTLAEDLALPLYNRDIDAINSLFATVKSYEDLAYIYLYDSEGRIVTDGTSENPRRGKVLTDSISKESIAEKKISMLRKGDVLNASIPIYFQSRKIGGIKAGFPLLKIKADILHQKETIASIKNQSARNTLIMSTSIGLISLLVGIFLALRTIRVLVHPILKLTEAARKIGKGDLTVKVDIKSGDELEEMASSFNQMTSDLYDRQQKLETLHNSAKNLTSNLKMESLLANSLSAVKQILKASKGSIMFLDDKGLLVVKESFGWKLEEIPRGKPFSIGEGIAGYVAKERKSILANDVNNYPLFQREKGRIWRGCRDLLCVPMIHEDKLKGVINIQDRTDGKPFTKTDVEYAEIIASSAALSLANIELVAEEIEKIRMEQELRTAELVQKTLFPQEAPKVAGAELANFFEPATETGGDWFGYIEDNHTKRLAILIGDVSGHGVPTALVTAAVHSFVKTLDTMKTRFYEMRELMQLFKNSKITLPEEVLSQSSRAIEDPLKPANLLKLLNNIVLDIGKRQLFMTFFASLLDLNTKRLTFASAGHNQPYFYRGELSSEDISNGIKHNLSILKASGMRLGDEELVDFEEQEIKLKKDDIILYFTDGIVECENEQGQTFGDKRLAKILENSTVFSPDAIKNNIISSVYKFCGNNPRKDDISLIVAKIN